MPVTTQNQYSVPTQANLSAAGTDHHSNGMVESPELLRWRADMLLDEMLLGGADLGAGQHTNGSHTNGHHVNGSHANGSQPYPDNGNYPANTHHVPSNSIMHAWHNPLHPRPKLPQIPALRMICTLPWSRMCRPQMGWGLCAEVT